MTSVDVASLILRVAAGGTMTAHGWNHAFGGVAPARPGPLPDRMRVKASPVVVNGYRI
jgi:hypothetical protein